MGCAPSSNISPGVAGRRSSSLADAGECDGDLAALDPPRTALPDVANHKPKDGTESDIPWSQGPHDTGQSQDRKPSGRRNSCLKLGTMRIPHEPIKILLSFSREDAQSNAWTWAARKLGHTSALYRTQENAVESFQANQHQLVVVDRRHSARTADADQLVRCIRATPGGRHAVVIAVVKRSALEREESSVQSLLEIGYDRCYPESGSLGACLNELTTLVCGEISSRRRLKAAEAVMSVLEMSRELVTITDQNHILQYINPACERILGYSMQDLANQNLVELLKVEGAKFDVADATVLAQKKGREWEGTMFYRRKTGDSVPLFTRVISLNVDGIPDKPEHIVLLQEAPPLLTDKFTSSELGGDLYPLARGSLRSIRKPSYDVRSLGSEVGNALRRQSLARLHSLAIEAPITKVINILAATQESSPPHVAQALDKVIDILRSAELYSPPILDTKGKSDDPVATDLLAALLLQGPRQSNAGVRRCSNESATRITPTALARPLLPSGSNLAVPIQLRDLLETDSDWGFDVIKLEKLTGRRPLVWLGLTIMSRFDVPRTLGCDEATLQHWLALIESHYHSSNSYHNSTHAADVLQSTAYFLVRPRIKDLLDPFEQAAALIAAAAHDIDHPGKNSAFLCNSGNDLAILYNDVSVLESHHAALTFKLTLSDDRVNIFKGLDAETYREMRKIVIDMILATEMTKHFEHLSKFVNVFTKPITKDDEFNADDLNVSNLSTPENITLVRRMLIKCADISNPVRPLKICVEWTRRIVEEYFSQTDEEKLKGLPVVMAQFERNSCSVPKSQIGFIDFFVSDMFDAWDAFIDIPELIGHMKSNYEYWKQQEAKGIMGFSSEYNFGSTDDQSRVNDNRIEEKDETVQDFL